MPYRPTSGHSRAIIAAAIFLVIRRFPPEDTECQLLARALADGLTEAEARHAIRSAYPDKQVDHPSYQLAIKATGLDLSTLQNYAYVSRNLPYSVRSERLSWEHHRLLAKLPEVDMLGWIKTCEPEEDAGRRMSTRRLRKSLALGRVATAADLLPDDSENGQENHIPLVNRFCGWWRRLQTSRFLATATREQRAAMKRDLEPIINIYNQL